MLPLILALQLVLPDAALDRAVSEAIARAPETTVARADTEAARRRIEPARTLPDPMASLTWDGDRKMVSAMASQALPWPGKLALNARAAEEDANAIESSETRRAALTIEARVRNAYYDLAVAHAVRHLIVERRETAEDIEKIARSRYAAGLAQQQDVVLAQVEIVRVGEQLNAQDALIAARGYELAALVGHDVEPGSIPFDEKIPPVDEVIAAALQRNAELAGAQASVDAAKTRVALAKKNLLPDFVVSAGPMIGSFRRTFGVGGGITLPLFAEKKQRNQIGEAEARVTAATAAIDALKRDITIRTRDRAASLDAATKTAILFKEKVLPLDELSMQSALSGYQAGKLPFVTVLDALHMLHDDQVAHLTHIVDAAKWRVAIEEAKP
ncbi:MAG TPA: TolC family protein [Thermoanaerobaculia bacterium]|nr:TolC family protein [Thermoanaerobaculia bacterium]